MSIQLKKLEVKRKTCPVCNYAASYPKGTGQKCLNCGTVMDGSNFIKHDDPDANYKTHDHIRWGCTECGNHGTAWVKKKTRLEYCPHCEKSSWSLVKSTISPKGDCDTIWEPVIGITRPAIRTKFKKRVKTCENCGHNHRYLSVHPISCPNCSVAW